MDVSRWFALWPWQFCTRRKDFGGPLWLYFLQSLSHCSAYASYAVRVLAFGTLIKTIQNIGRRLTKKLVSAQLCLKAEFCQAAAYPVFAHGQASMKAPGMLWCRAAAAIRSVQQLCFCQQVLETLASMTKSRPNISCQGNAGVFPFMVKRNLGDAVGGRFGSLTSRKQFTRVLNCKSITSRIWRVKAMFNILPQRAKSTSGVRCWINEKKSSKCRLSLTW